jgi:hypothetical protein
MQGEEVQVGKANTGLETNDDSMPPSQNAGITNSKTAAEDPKGHHLRRHLLGNATSAAIEAKKGKKMKAFGEALKHEAGSTIKGTGIGGAAGAALGAGASLLSKGKVKPGTGARVGASLGGYAGGAVGQTKGRHGAKASEIHGKYSKHNKEASAPMDYIRAKLAEDAINPAKIDGGGTVDPAKPPPGASASGEDVPSEPGDVSRQKGMISSNESAINYTKRDAKADPKSDVAQTLDEPPLSASTDPVLQKTLDHTSSAGVKISSAKSMAKTAQQVGAQRVVLRRLLSKVAEDSRNTSTGV